MHDALRETLDEFCRPHSAPSHRLVLIDTAAGPSIVVAADHSHVDMWSLLVLTRDLLRALGEAEAGETPALEVAPAFADHTRALLARPPAPDGIRERWSEILTATGGVLPRFPLPLGEIDQPQPERVEIRDVLDVDATASFEAEAADRGVSTLALAVAAMTAVTLELVGEPLRAVFPVHSRYHQEWHSSVGWFITNAVIESTSTDPQACAAAVREAISLGSWPLADVLAPWGGWPSAPGMFAVSWLDLRRLPVRIDSVGLDAQYVSAAIRTSGVMVWFILDERGLRLRCRYPDTDQARASVGRWLDQLVSHLQAQATMSVGGLLRLDAGTFRVERAARSDATRLVQLLSDDEIGATREGADLARYEAAYDAIAQDPQQYLVAVRDALGLVVATMQLTIIPGLSRRGSTRLQIEGLRVTPALRGKGLGTAMLEWAHEHGRARGAQLAQVTTDAARTRARDFYAKLGYETSQVGLKRML
jgi:GNAT superfamily N-acetyltransferase